MRQEESRSRGLVGRIVLWGPVAASMAAIFLASSSSDPGPAVVSDKVAHAAAYFVLTVFVFRALAAGTWSRATARTAVLSILVSVLYGLSDEVHQAFVPNRQPDLLDVAADAAGAAAAAGGLWAWGIIRRFFAASRQHHVLRQPDPRA